MPVSPWPLIGTMKQTGQGSHKNQWTGLQNGEAPPLLQRYLFTAFFIQRENPRNWTSLPQEPMDRPTKQRRLTSSHTVSLHTTLPWYVGRKGQPGNGHQLISSAKTPLRHTTQSTGFCRWRTVYLKPADQRRRSHLIFCPYMSNHPIDEKERAAG